MRLIYNAGDLTLTGDHALQQYGPTAGNGARGAVGGAGETAGGVGRAAAGAPVRSPHDDRAGRVIRRGRCRR